MFGIAGSDSLDNVLYADLSKVIDDTSIAMIVLSGVAVALRFYSRRLVNQPILADDWLILVAMVFAWLLCVICIISTEVTNFGRHFITSTPSQMVRFLQMLLPYEVCWTLSCAFTKISILCFYRRIFSTPATRIPALVLGGLVITWTFATLLNIILSCVPVQKFWNPSLPGRCQNLQHQIIGTAIPNVVLDTALLLFPIPLVISLQLPRRQKLAIGGIFAVGALVVLMASIRMVTIAQADSVDDATWVTIPMGIFSNIETSVGVICACLPSMTPLFRSILKKRHFSNGSSTLIASIRSRSGKREIVDGEYALVESRGGDTPQKREYVLVESRGGDTPQKKFLAVPRAESQEDTGKEVVRAVSPAPDLEKPLPVVPTRYDLEWQPDRLER